MARFSLYEMTTNINNAVILSTTTKAHMLLVVFSDIHHIRWCPIHHIIIISYAPPLCIWTKRSHQRWKIHIVAWRNPIIRENFPQYPSFVRSCHWLLRHKAWLQGGINVIFCTLNPCRIEFSFWKHNINLPCMECETNGRFGCQCRESSALNHCFF